MKKLFAIFLTVAMLASMATIASAESTTTLTTTVPAATYTLNIPADQEIPFGATTTDIGTITVTNETGFAEGKDLRITINYSDFVCEGVSTSIPFSLGAHYQGKNEDYGTSDGTISNGGSLVFKGTDSGKLATPKSSNIYFTFDSFFVAVNSADWGKALAGDYTATITFTAEVVAE